jgi:transposase
MENKSKKVRISSKKKTEIVLDLLRGISIEELSRLNKVAVHEITAWRNAFVENGSKGLKRGKKDSNQSELERIIGKQQMEIELLKKKKTAFGKTPGSL